MLIKNLESCSFNSLTSAIPDYQYSYYITIRLSSSNFCINSVETNTKYQFASKATEKRNNREKMKSFVLCLSLLGIFGASFAQVPGGKNPITDEARASEIRQLVSTHLKKLDGQANGGNLELVQTHYITSQVVAGVLYDLLAEINENKTPVNCTISLWEKPWMDFVKLDLECGDEKRKYTYASHPDSRRKRQIGTLGGFQDLSSDGLKDLKPKLTTTFNHLGSQHDDFDLTLKDLESGEYQVVAGTIYRLKVKATSKANPNEEKLCDVEILENLKSEFDRVTVKCEHKDKTFLYTKQ